jgi:hypothetical protein
LKGLRHPCTVNFALGDASTPAAPASQPENETIPVAATATAVVNRMNCGQHAPSPRRSVVDGQTTAVLTPANVTPNQPGNPSDGPPWRWQPQGFGSPPNPQLPPPSGNPPPPRYPQQYPYPGYSSYPGYPGHAVDPQAPFGRDPATGLPLSDKSATTPGLLQLFLGLFGIGRLYIGSTQIAVAQLCVGLLGIVYVLPFRLSGSARRRHLGHRRRHHDVHGQRQGQITAASCVSRFNTQSATLRGRFCV